MPRQLTHKGQGTWPAGGSEAFQMLAGNWTMRTSVPKLYQICSQRIRACSWGNILRARQRDIQLAARIGNQKDWYIDINIWTSWLCMEFVKGFIPAHWNFSRSRLSSESGALVGWNVAPFCLVQQCYIHIWHKTRYMLLLSPLYILCHICISITYASYMSSILFFRPCACLYDVLSSLC